MNLHIAPDNTFINAFYENLIEASVLENNRIVIRTNNDGLKLVKHNIPFAPLYSAKFDSLCGDTGKYDKVFIHLFSPLMYRWVARNSFKHLGWMIWGADLYNLPSLDFDFYEEITKREYHAKSRPLTEQLYLLKVWLTNSRFRDKAYSKVNSVLTWMTTEYSYAKANLPSLKAEHRFFFYENQAPYQKLDELRGGPIRNSNIPSIIVGNSGYPANNHLDVVEYIRKHGIHANLRIPVSYGDPHYIAFLKNKLSVYEHGNIEFIDKYMAFEEYLTFLNSNDALVMNTRRPQGYGNVLMMLYLGKAVFMNRNNISLPDLHTNGIKTDDWNDMASILNLNTHTGNKEAVASLFSHNKLLDIYRELFA